MARTSRKLASGLTRPVLMVVAGVLLRDRSLVEHRHRISDLGQRLGCAIRDHDHLVNGLEARIGEGRVNRGQAGKRRKRGREQLGK